MGPKCTAIPQIFGECLNDSARSPRERKGAEGGFCLLRLEQGPGVCKRTFPGENTASDADDRTASGVPEDSGGQARSQVRGQHLGTDQTEKQGWRQQCQLQGHSTGAEVEDR